MRRRSVDRDDSRGGAASPLVRRWRYEYEKIGHGWVSRLAKRRPAAPADGKAVAAALGDGWEAGGSGGLIKICRTARAVDAAPPAVLDALLRADEGARD